jgi:hypothetical protein
MNGNNNNIRRPKIDIIPIEIYDGITKVVAEDDKHRYVLTDKGHIIKLRRKNCVLCPNSASFIIIFGYAKHRRVERFCPDHASNYGELPDIPLQEYELSSKQKIAIEAMQKWNNIKVKVKVNI